VKKIIKYTSQITLTEKMTMCQILIFGKRNKCKDWASYLLWGVWPSWTLKTGFDG